MANRPGRERISQKLATLGLTRDVAAEDHDFFVFTGEHHLHRHFCCPGGKSISSVPEVHQNEANSRCRRNCDDGFVFGSFPRADVETTVGASMGDPRFWPHVDHHHCLGCLKELRKLASVRVVVLRVKADGDDCSSNRPSETLRACSLLLSCPDDDEVASSSVPVRAVSASTDDRNHGSHRNCRRLPAEEESSADVIDVQPRPPSLASSGEGEEDDEIDEEENLAKFARASRELMMLDVEQQSPHGSRPSGKQDDELQVRGPDGDASAINGDDDGAAAARIDEDLVRGCEQGMPSIDGSSDPQASIGEEIASVANNAMAAGINTPPKDVVRNAQEKVAMERFEDDLGFELPSNNLPPGFQFPPPKFRDDVKLMSLVDANEWKKKTGRPMMTKNCAVSSVKNSQAASSVPGKSISSSGKRASSFHSSVDDDSSSSSGQPKTKKSKIDVFPEKTSRSSAKTQLAPVNTPKERKMKAFPLHPETGGTAAVARHLRVKKEPGWDFEKSFYRPGKCDLHRKESFLHFPDLVDHMARAHSKPVCFLCLEIFPHRGVSNLEEHLKTCDHQALFLANGRNPATGKKKSDRVLLSEWRRKAEWHFPRPEDVARVPVADIADFDGNGTITFVV